jgi:ubiquitin carboxyl-terminal hydrolase L5
MPPKSRKRKAPAKSNGTTNNGDNALTPPDRNTWPGWVEMESEPAFFNTMLKDMGVHGVKTSEVWSLEDNELAVLPQPVHALIFLFRYRETDKDDLVTECPAHVWYAQVLRWVETFAISRNSRRT